MAIGDLDGDGDMDIARLVVEGHATRDVAWSVAFTHGFGDGTFGPSNRIDLPYEAEDLDLGDVAVCAGVTHAPRRRGERFTERTAHTAAAARAHRGDTRARSVVDGRDRPNAPLFARG